MANLIQATVYQIDGAPQQPSAITLDFQTSNIVIREDVVSTIPAVQACIYYYNVVNNQQSVQKFFVSEDVATLVAAANVGGTSQLQVTVLEINGDPQVPGGVQYSFPANQILVGESVDAVTGVNAYVQFKGVKYFTSETEATILSNANANSTSGSGTTNYVAKWTSANTLGNSLIQDNGTTVTVNSVVVGRGAGNLATNVLVGESSFSSNTSGINNTILGYGALPLTTSSSNNTAIGYLTMSADVSTGGTNNVAIGAWAMSTKTGVAGAGNVAVGCLAMSDGGGTGGSNNTAVGYQSLRNNNGNRNVSIGYQSMRFNLTGANNVAVGWQSLYNTTGTQNMA